MSEKNELLTTHRKALTINLDGSRYGTIAEIGAGQEVARVFFQAGSASGSIAKTMSAYDMTFSDAIYGKAPRYVSRERLQTMLHHEFALLQERLAQKRGERTRFFVFADTVAAKSARVADGHGWLGIRFQLEPLGEPHEVVIHVRMWDKKNVLQQEALGIVGTNLIYAAFHYAADPDRFLLSLVDNVGTDRIEVDMVQFRGPAFAHVDNRRLALLLVRHGLTNAALFAPDGTILQPSEAFFNKAVLVERGTFRPVTRVNVDVIEGAARQFRAEPALNGRETMVVMEMALRPARAEDAFDAADYLARVDLIGRVGLPAMVSNYSEYFRLVGYFRRYTKERVGVALGINALLDLFHERDYEHLDGGILESMGRLFKDGVKLYVHPMRPATLQRFRGDAGGTRPPVPDVDLITAVNVEVSPRLRYLYRHLLENDCVGPIADYRAEHLDTCTRDVPALIAAGDPSWEAHVPSAVAAEIRARGLFGCAPAVRA